jgi:hypothetical protein
MHVAMLLQVYGTRMCWQQHRVFAEKAYLGQMNELIDIVYLQRTPTTP